MNEIPRSENGISFLVEEIRVLSLTWDLGPKSVKCSWGSHGTFIFTVPPKKKFVLWNDGGFSSLLSFSVMSKPLPAPGQVCPAHHCPVLILESPWLSRLLPSLFPPSAFFFFLIMRRSPRAHTLFSSYHNLECNCKLESPWLLSIMMPTIVWENM